MSSKKEQQTQLNSSYFNGKSIEAEPLKGGIFSLIHISSEEGERYAIVMGRVVISNIYETEAEAKEAYIEDHDLYMLKAVNIMLNNTKKDE